MNKPQTTDLSLPTLLLVLFIGLKLGHVITWSWWWVLTPLWFLPALFIVLAVVAALLGLVAKLGE